MKYDVLSEKELVRLYQTGDEKSFEILLNLNKDRVYGYIFSKVRNHELANDLFQEVFIKVVRTLKNGMYNDEGKFLPWVLTIAHNMIVDHFRKAKKMQMISESSSKNEEFNIFAVLKLTDRNIEDSIIKEQIESDVVKLIEYLPDEQRDVLVNRLFRGMSFKDIAEQEDISINTALGRMRYALINLRKLVDKHKVSITA
ncbi:MAG: sigma-70 family RNA polymerase sigma factor [Crocinitomicaceae bacterium]|nr:sigma-70 family RNA polymerase sigma factor [Crocinitomicaceae bacterium]MBK8925061.1 sigma-70 family RNA polymerase sigma factor [Crocinitomicaceae bacterium]